MEWYLNIFGGQRIAVRQGSTLTYLHGDHLGSASLATSVTGTLVSQRRYLPYGETRPDFAASPFPTDRRFTGQREEVTLGVYDYGARFYSPGLGRFLSADTVVPEAGRPQSLNRYSYGYNNPLKYIDPTGHLATVPVFALIGGLFTTGVYLATVPLEQMRAEDLVVVAAVGIVGGALIGTGVGAGAGAAIMGSVLGVSTGAGAAIAGAAGVGTIASAGGYMASNLITQEKFDRTNFIIDSVGGGIEGGLSAATGGLGSIAISGGMAAGSSVLKDKMHNRPIDVEQAAIAGIAGIATGSAGEYFSGGFRPARDTAADSFLEGSSTRDCINLTYAALSNSALKNKVLHFEGFIGRKMLRTAIRDTTLKTIENQLSQ
jgi:RHS repeat-associated protein